MLSSQAPTPHHPGARTYPRGPHKPPEHDHDPFLLLIHQAGMAGGFTTPELVAAVSEAGGLGTLGAAIMSPQVRAGVASHPIPRRY
jgi:hypothetical protein